MSEVKRQRIPPTILNSEWKLESVGGVTPDCGITMKLQERGQLTFWYMNELYWGDNLWYLVKDSVIVFHTTPMEKIAWTLDNCAMNPSVFALYLNGEKNVVFENDRLVFDTFEKKRFVFKRV